MTLLQQALSLSETLGKGTTWYEGKMVENLSQACVILAAEVRRLQTLDKVNEAFIKGVISGEI